MGPIYGPRTAPITYAPIAPALFSLGIKSAMEPVPSVTGHEAMIPARNRNTTSDARLLATAQAMLKMTNRNAHVLYRMALPYSSDNGAISIGPKV
jgi:hypothetical protein